MGRKKYSSEQVIIMLRETEVLFSQGTQFTEVCRKPRIPDGAHYRHAFNGV